MPDTIPTITDSTFLRQQLALALTDAAEGLLPSRSDCSREAFYPLREIKSAQELLWTLDYAAENAPTPGDTREGYLLYVNNYPEFHPVFLLSAVYVLLAAGAEVHVRYGQEREQLCNRIPEALAKRGLVREFLPRDPDCDQEVRDYITRHRLTNLVFLGDAANSHCRLPLVRDTGIRRLFSPADHLLIADFAQEPVWNEKRRLFEDLCWSGSVDYEGYRAPTNQAEEVYLGFDFGDLFWGADAVVKERKAQAVIADKIPAILFTDRPRDRVWRPKGIESCCAVVFFEDYDCRFPLYDFSQLV